ncbi:hypothetical protein D9613_000993 [Agrocybe pediades]|uniref:Homeobox domain-containing protein n=1 Tax=Agrocybe pediades TaxID=84607 RepID=A0A8H4R0V4_9AGAR|nr:hypothetical protein D9613_000993 [Agrocybe pediades]
MSQFTVLNEESSIQQPETSISSSKPGQRAPTTRHRLTEVATQYLEECFIKHQGQMPDIRTREALAIEIQKIPGNGHVKQIHVYNYFTRRSTKQQSQSQTMPACDRRYPSMTREAISTLEVLTRGQLNPDPELVKTWASLLKGCTVQDIYAWLHYKRIDDAEKAHTQRSASAGASTSTPEPYTYAPPTPISPTPQFLNGTGVATPPWLNNPSSSANVEAKPDPRSPVLPPLPTNINTLKQNLTVHTSQQSYQAQQQQQQHRGSSLPPSTAQKERNYVPSHGGSLSLSSAPHASYATQSQSTYTGQNKATTPQTASTPVTSQSKVPSQGLRPPPSPRRAAILKAAAETLLVPPPKPTGNPPRTLDEFQAAMAPYRVKMADIMKALGNPGA